MRNSFYCVAKRGNGTKNDKHGYNGAENILLVTHKCSTSTIMIFKTNKQILTMEGHGILSSTPPKAWGTSDSSIGSRSPLFSVFPPPSSKSPDPTVVAVSGDSSTLPKRMTMGSLKRTWARLCARVTCVVNRGGGGYKTVIRHTGERLAILVRWFEKKDYAN